MAQKRCSMDAFTESELDVLRAPKEWRRELDLQTGDDEAMDVEVEAMDAGVQFGIDSSSSARPPTSSRSLTPGDGCEFATYSGFPECGGPGFPPHFQGTSVNGHVHFCFVCGYRKVKKNVAVCKCGRQWVLGLGPFAAAGATRSFGHAWSRAASAARKRASRGPCGRTIARWRL